MFRPRPQHLPAVDPEGRWGRGSSLGLRVQACPPFLPSPPSMDAWKRLGLCSVPHEGRPPPEHSMHPPAPHQWHLGDPLPAAWPVPQQQGLRPRRPSGVTQPTSPSPIITP